MPTKDYCSICNHPEVKDINSLLLQGTQIVSIPALFNNSFHRKTVFEHVKNCLKTTSLELRKQGKINSIIDADNEYNDIVQKSKEMLESAREVLLVNGELNLHPREWEISVVYTHPFLTDDNGKPLVLTDTLANVIDLLAGKNIKVKKSMLKMEDARKTYRSAIQTHKELLENYYRIFGAFKHEPTPFDDELEHWRTTIKHIAAKLNSDYRTQLESFLIVYRERIRRDLVEALTKELNTLPRQLPSAPTTGMPEKGCLLDADVSALNSPGKENIDIREKGEE